MQPPPPPLGFSLLQAACCGHRDILELMLDAVSPSELPGLLAVPSDARGRSPLHFAAANGDYSAAGLLLARGIDADVSWGAGFEGHDAWHAAEGPALLSALCVPLTCHHPRQPQ